jgi:hypothetical protein
MCSTPKYLTNLLLVHRIYFPLNCRERLFRPFTHRYAAFSDICQPVDENDSQAKWEKLLGDGEIAWEDMFTDSKAPDVRRSQFPAGGTDLGHFDAWFDRESDEHDLVDPFCFYSASRPLTRGFRYKRRRLSL